MTFPNSYYVVAPVWIKTVFNVFFFFGLLNFDIGTAAVVKVGLLLFLKMLLLPLVLGLWLDAAAVPICDPPREERIRYIG